MEELGMSCVALEDYESATFNGFTKRLRPKDNTAIVPEYAAYYFRSPKFRLEITAMSSLSTRASLNNEMLGRLKMTLPSLEEQAAIGVILKKFDDKIELNRRMNATLEAIARALFKSWFVDFDPVWENIKRKEGNARVPGRKGAEESAHPGAPALPEHILALFPDGFEDSELGPIPAGWRVGRVADLGEIVCGKTPPTRNPENYGTDVPFITIPDMHGKVFAPHTRKMLSRIGANTQVNKFLPKFSICVSCIATPGLVVITSEKSQTNQQINSVIPFREFSPFYCYELLNRLGDQIRSGGSGGSVFANLNKTRFSNINIVLAHPSQIDAFHELVEPLFEAMLANERESRTLAALRDTLLPRLISGELRVADAERFLAEAGV